MVVVAEASHVLAMLAHQERRAIESSSDKPEIVFDSKKTFLIMSFASFLADK